VAEKLNRRWVAIELDERYIEGGILRFKEQPNLVETYIKLHGGDKGCV